MTDRNKWQDRLRGGDEQDFLTRFHHWLKKKPGERKAAKRKWNKRIRRLFKRQASVDATTRKDEVE